MHATFSPEDPTQLLVTGTNVYKFFKISENSMRATQTQLAKKEKTRCSAHYTCHLWLEKRIVVCT
jgi:hypothetical protein